MWESEASEGKTYEESVKDSVLQTLEDMVLLEQHMKEYEVSISEAEELVIKDSAQAFDEVNAWEDHVKVSGSETAVERVLTLMAIQQKMQDAIQKGADMEVSDEEAAQKSMQYVEFAYTVESEEDAEDEEDDEESREMTDEEKKEVQKKAEEFAKAAKGEKDFEAYAKGKEFEVKKATFDAESMSPSEELIKAADKLKEGETTGVIKTDDGCYVARVTSLLDREATDAKKDTIVSERKQELYTES